MQSIPEASPSRPTRRAVIAGAAGVGLAAIGAAAGLSRLGDGGGAPDKVAGAASSPTTTTAPPPTATPRPALAARPSPQAANAARVSRSVRAFAEVPAGSALVASLRLPLFGVGSADAGKLLAGEMPDWLEVGSPISLPVELLAIEGQVPNGSSPAATYGSYDELAAALAAKPGGVAVVPLEAVDWRVNVLAVDGVDPLRDGDERLIRIGIVGDIVPGRNVHNKMRFYGDFSHPFRKIAAELSSYDLSFANLEGNLSANIAPPDDAHTFSFVSDPAMVDGMKLAGIDAVSLANNHSTWNSAGWGTSALLDTLDALDGGGVAHFGAGRNLDEARAPWVAEAKGRRVAVIGIDGVTANESQRERDATVWDTWLGAANYAGAGPDQPGTNPYVADQFLGDIAALAADYDIVIPYIHCGREYIALPPEWAVDGARAAIEAGATFVVTNHPHVVQAMSSHQGRPIVFSVGNFIFDQMFSAEVRQGMILEVALRGSAVVGLRMRGVEIEDFHQPRLMNAGEHAALMDRFWAHTDALARR